ncbi:MAG: OB-fold protein [Bacteroidia bacterium]
MNDLFKKLLLLGLVVGVIGGGIGFYLFSKKVASTNDVKTDFTLKMEDLYADFEKDEKAAVEKYKGKVIEVSGVVKSKSDEDKQHIAVTLGNESMSGEIGVSLEPEQAEKAAALKEGSAVVLKGECTGIQSAEGGDSESLLDALGKEVQLKKGIVISTK